MDAPPTYCGSALLVAALQLACTERKYLDEYCNASNSPPPEATLPFVGLFHRDGRPLFRPARVRVTYGANTMVLPVNPRLAAELLASGRQAEYLVMSPDRAGNLYTFPNNADIAMYPCALPLQYRVEAEGCVAVSGSYSWNDNTYPERLDVNFHLPLRLDCTGEDPPPDAASPTHDATP